MPCGILHVEEYTVPTKLRRLGDFVLLLRWTAPHVQARSGTKELLPF